MSTLTRERPVARPQQAARRRAAHGWAHSELVLSNALRRARSGRRLTAILVLYLLLTAAMGWRLVSVQVMSAEEYRELGVRQTQREQVLPARRGEIQDREGRPLAVSLTAASIYVNPPAVAAAGVDPATLAAQLAAAVGGDQAAILAKITSPDTFEYVARQVPREVGLQVAAMGLAGVGWHEEPTRVYPSAPLAAPLIGYAGIDHNGLSGMEIEYDEVLTGTPGMLHLERAPGGLEISAAPREAVPPVPGTSLVMTIDREIQAAAEGALSRAVTAHQADGGAAVVLDRATGEILALATVNGEGGEPREWRTRAITDFYEPGSVNKVITLSAALEEGLVRPDTVVAIPTAHTVGGKTFEEQHPSEDGTLTTTEIMVRSSNVGTIRVAELLGPERLHAYAQRFGYGQRTGLDFPGESAGLLPDVADWSGTSLPTIAIGHGVSATLLQVAGVYATIANGGEWLQPSLVRGTRTAAGELVGREAPQRRRVISEGTARSVARMLGGVVESEYGTGAAAAVPGYHIAGKTGTARKPKDGGYEAGAYVASFAGFAPVDDPRLVVAVMVDEPRAGGYYGGTVAAPVFSEIMGFALSHERVPPSPGQTPAART